MGCFYIAPLFLYSFLVVILNWSGE